MSEVARALGARIREVRKAHGLSLERTAELAEVSLTFLGEVERGKKEPSISTLQRLARALSVSVTDLVTVIDDTPPGVSKHELLGQLRGVMREWYTHEESEAILRFVQDPRT